MGSLSGRSIGVKLPIERRVSPLVILNRKIKHCITGWDSGLTLEKLSVAMCLPRCARLLAPFLTDSWFTDWDRGQLLATYLPSPWLGEGGGEGGGWGRGPQPRSIPGLRSFYNLVNWDTLFVVFPNFVGSLFPEINWALLTGSIRAA